ncbi:4-carboxymuconolactone decarboxylase [Mycobacterium sp. 1100029.7]|nr:4-carboxymuconolactone decarboxylase [Mycobacterium sp. 1100029.7]
MRLLPLPPGSLAAEQQLLYQDISAVVDQSFGELVARRADGALIGPFNAWLHYPEFGSAAWALNKSLWLHRRLPGSVHQLAILVTAAKFGARYQIYGHEYFAIRDGLSADKVATIVAGERPADLTEEEGVVYDMASALARGGVLPETTYRAVIERFGEQGAAEVVFLVGCFALVAVTLNAFDAAVPGREG